MARKQKLPGKSLLALFALLVAWLILPATIKKFLSVAFYEFQAPLWTAISYVHDWQDYSSLRQRSKNELIEAGRDLSRQNAYLELNIQENKIIRNELERLETLLGLPSYPAYRYEIARVVKREQNTWWQRLIVRKGSKHGITEGAAVVFSGGVVGRVAVVHTYTSEIQLVSSSRFRVAAHFENDLRPVTYQGGINLAFRAPFGRVRNVPADIIASEENPRRLVSSRLGGIFPDGLTIGWVEDMVAGSEGLFQDGMVRLDPRLLSLREVAILVPINTYED